MTTDQIQLIKATIPVLKENGVALTSHFYKRMFEFNPELKHIFNMGNQANSRQQTALAMAVLAYAEHIEDPSVLLPVVNNIGHKHTSLNIRPEHYDIVGTHLIASIKEVLGDAASNELLEAWTVAYGQLAQLMIGHEQTLYNQDVHQKGGWTGWRPFKVISKTNVANNVITFKLQPVDKGLVVAHIPGQYLSVKVMIPEIELLQPRQYSITSTPNNDYYTITVKRDINDKGHNGMISNILHDNILENDIIEVAAPKGTFTIKDTDAPKIFIGGGVGITPLWSMLNSALNKDITLIYGCKSENDHIFKDDLDLLKVVNRNFKSVVFYDVVNNNDAIEGVVDLNRIEPSLINTVAEYYLCGPKQFIINQYNTLLDKGIDKSQIFFEEFGPASLNF